MAQVTIYGARPARPSGITGRSISDGLWNLVQTCWSEDFVTRPSAQDIVRFHMEQS